MDHIACKRKNKDGSPWNPSGKHVYLCGENFITGKPSKDPNHPDFVPSRFVFVQRSEEKSKIKLKRLQSASRRARRKLSTYKSNVSTTSTTNKNTEANTGNNTPQLDIAATEVSFESEESNERLISLERELKAVSSKLTKVVEQRDRLTDFNKGLEIECQSLRQEKSSAYETIQKLQSKFLSYETLKVQPDKFKYYTGIGIDKFEIIFDYLKGYMPHKCKVKLSYEDQLLMTLVKLRLNPQWVSLADQFNSSKTSLNDIFWKWIDLIYYQLSFLIKWPDHEASLKTLPKVFKQFFPRLTGIIDCTEIFID